MGAEHRNTARMRALRVSFRAECEAEDARCWICNFPIDYSLPPNSKAVPYSEYAHELDHYVPVSVDPTLYEDRANFRASHAGCNRARGNRKPLPAIGAVTRDWFI